MLKDSDICDHIIYFNKETGYKISEFYRNACVCNAGNDNDAKRCMIFCRIFTKESIVVKFPLIRRELTIMNRYGRNKTIYEDYNSVKKEYFKS